MATVAKPRKLVNENPVAVKALASVSSHPVPQSSTHFTPEEETMIVEQYLERKFEEMMKDFRAHSEGLIQKLRNEYQQGAAEINAMVNSSSAQAPSTPLCVTLKCMAGPHVGQKFRLEATSTGAENVFRMGRSTGKNFKENGVSLYKDKEISTTHAKIEIKNGQAFLIDAESTNGTALNGDEIPSLTPFRLKEGDVIAMGSTELTVSLCAIDQENFCANK